MANISDPYSIRYPEICAVADVDGKTVELIEEFACTGGAMWAGHNYQKSPLVQSVRVIGNTQRFLLSAGKTTLPLEGSYFPAGIAAVVVTDDEIGITYRGVGGGGVGATVCRAEAKGVIRSKSDPCGGGREAGAQIWLPRRERVIIGVDDTDTPEEGATWTLAHNIAEAVQTPETRYLSHTIVQLFPVPYRTKNCVGVACEFATSEPERLVAAFEELLRKYTLSDETGMAVFRGFSPAPLMDYGWKVKHGEVTRDDLDAISEHIECRLNGRGIIGAAAAIPFATRYHEALSICTGEP
ncbi:methanogenesis marker protein 11 [Methanogenium cariaci]